MCDCGIVWAFGGDERDVGGEQGVDDGVVRFAAGTFVFRVNFPLSSSFLSFVPRRSPPSSCPHTYNVHLSLPPSLRWLPL